MTRKKTAVFNDMKASLTGGTKKDINSQRKWHFSSTVFIL